MAPSGKKNEEQKHHFFASTVVSWGIGATRAEAIAKAARLAGATIIDSQRKANKEGLYVWTCRVDVPQSTNYSINNFAPDKLTVGGVDIDVHVPTSRSMEFAIVNTKGHVVPLANENRPGVDPQ